MQLTIDGETFRVEVEGAEDRPAIMLSCSLGTDLTLFEAQMPALLEHFRVVRYDPRGHGGSTVAGAPYSLARLGRDALAILDALAIETMHFVGISMGGAVGQWLLVNAPERIDRAVLANTAARLGTPETWNARIATVLAQGTQAIAPATMERWFSDAFRERAPERVAAVDAVFRGTSAEGYAGACAALRDMDLREAIQTIARPVLVVSGRADAVAGADDIAVLTGAIRGARHVALDCRHISNIEEAAAFDAAVAAFLTAPTPARAARARKPTPRRAAARASAARSPLKAAKPTPEAGEAKPAARGRTTTPAKAARRAARGAVASKATTKKAAPKKTAAKKASTKKVVRKPAARRTAVGRPARKAVAVRVTARKAAAKPAAKTASPKKAVAGKLTAKKTTKKGAPRKTTARRPAPPRRPSPKRPGGRKR